MHRLALRILKFGLPTAYLLMHTNKIWNAQSNNQDDDINQNGKLNSKLETIENKIKQIENSQRQSQKQKESEQKKKNSEQVINLSSQQQNKQEHSQNQNNNLQPQQQNKILQQKPLSELETHQQTPNQVFKQAKGISTKQFVQANESQKNQQYALISGNIPQFIINYLKMYTLNIKVDKQSKSSQLKITNKVGDIKEFAFQQQNSLLLQSIINFLNPPKIIQTNEQIIKAFKNLQPDQYIIATYIPNQNEYKQSKLPKNYYDTFTPLQSLDIQQIQSDFREQKYKCCTHKYSYFIIKNQEVAKTMKMNFNRIGDRYIFYKSSPNHGMEVSSLIQGMKYTIRTIPLQQAKAQNLDSKGLHSYLNEINYEMDMKSFIRMMQKKGEKRKILVLYSKQKRAQFQNSVKAVATKVGKLMREQALVVFTNNEALLSKYFQIIPDDFVTIRLIDPNKEQSPLLSLPGFNNYKPKTYSRRIMSGPFNVQNLCNFIQGNGNQNQYYEKKKELNKIPQIISQSQQIPNKTVVLHWKYGCNGCELTLKYLQKIKQIFENSNEEQRLKFEIANPLLAKQISFRKFNILNEDGSQNGKQNGQTPKLKFYVNGEMKDLGIADIIGRISSINPHNEEQVHIQIMKQIIESIERQSQWQ